MSLSPSSFICLSRPTVLYKASDYGPLFSLRQGSRDTVVVSSAVLARECFTEHDLPFVSRSCFPSLDLVSFGGTSTRLPTSRYGPYWRNLRRVAMVQLLIRAPRPTHAPCRRPPR
jgi:hypothetical protein